ncbi:MAG: hypothetical protein BWY98_00047 [Tenericutes bacterium ADurb.BinA155]|jgi:hypothetical protein|nr:MAG: hypothetical protein BWY98_00047 [Tenericutes bacterium ADurb.BinA155]
MGVKQTGKAYPKSDALLLMYGILNAEKRLDEPFFCNVTGLSERTFRRYLHQCQLWLSRFRPDMKLLRFIEQGAISYGLFRADDPDPLVHEIKEFDYEQPEWGMKPRD